MARPSHFWSPGYQLRNHARDHASLHVHGRQLTKNIIQEALHDMFFYRETYHNEAVKRHFYYQHAVIMALVVLIVLAIVISGFQIVY